MVNHINFIFAGEIIILSVLERFTWRGLIAVSYTHLPLRKRPSLQMGGCVWIMLPDVLILARKSCI